METDIGEGPRGVQTDWLDVIATNVEGDVIFDKVNSSPARLEGKEVARRTPTRLLYSHSLVTNHCHEKTHLPHRQPHLSPKYSMTHLTNNFPMLKSC